MKKSRFKIVAVAGLIVAAMLASSVAKAQSPAADIALPGSGECHTQGITVSGDYLFVSCVERKGRRALLFRWLLPDGFPLQALALPAPEITEITAQSMYHPSGLDQDGKCVWAAVAHYRSFMARSKVMCLDPGSLAEIKSFEVDDHIGAVAVMGETILALNWDARDIYRYSKDGKLQGKDRSPGSVSYQDCAGVGKDQVLCSGPGPASKKGKPEAVVELLTFDPAKDPVWTVTRRTLLSVPDASLGNEGFAAWNGYWLFLPEDFPLARIFVFKADTP